MTPDDVHALEAVLTFVFCAILAGCRAQWCGVQQENETDLQQRRINQQSNELERHNRLARDEQEIRLKQLQLEELKERNRAKELALQAYVAGVELPPPEPQETTATTKAKGTKKS